MVELLRPQDLKKISDDIDMANAKKAFEKSQAKEQEEKDLKEAFMSRDLHAEVTQRVNTAVKRAAEQGMSQLQVLSFPASYCNDRGRRINNHLDGWQDTLPGVFRKIYHWWENELQPGGFTFSARIIDYPGGMPGEVGIFIGWPASLD